MPSYVIRHREGFPDEVEADSYVDQDDDLVFTQDGVEVFRVPKADVVSVVRKGEVSRYTL